MRWHPYSPLFTCLVVSLSCSDDSTCICDELPGSPATVQIFSGDAQHAPVFSTLTDRLVVEVLDESGSPVGGASVTFATPSEGTVSPTDVVTNSSGQAGTWYTLGPTAGEQKVTASVGNLTPAEFTIIAEPGVPSSVVVVSGDQQTGTVGTTLTEPVVVRVTDNGGNVTPDVSIQFSPASGSVDPTTATSDGNGEASAVWTLGGEAGNQTLQISVGGVTRMVSATATAAEPQNVAIVGGESQVGERGSELSGPIVARVTDAYGNPNMGILVVFEASGDGSISPASVTTDGLGRAEAMWTLGSDLGTQTAVASVAGVGSATVTAEATVPLSVLDHVAVDAVLDMTRDRIVTVSADPHRLNVVDPVSGGVTSVSLDLTPNAVSVQPDGAYAAVGHNGFISYVNLNTLSVEQVYGVTTDVIDLELPGNGWVYAFPRIDQWETIRSIELSTGAETNTGTIRAGTLVKLHPSGDFIYGADNGLSPSDFEKYDIRGGAAVYMYDSPYHGDFSFAGNLWIYEDGTRIVARSGNVFTSSSVRSQDMLYVGALSDVGIVSSAAHSTALQRVLVVGLEGFNEPLSELQAYTASFLSYHGSLALPPYVEVDAGVSTLFESEGRFVFANSTGTRVYVLVRGRPPYEGRFSTGLAVFEGVDIP